MSINKIEQLVEQMVYSNSLIAASQETAAQFQHNIAIALEEKKASKALFSRLLVSHKSAHICESTVNPLIEPTEITANSCSLFEATNAHAGFVVLQDLMKQSKAIA
jgi:hypothetical protein